LPTTEEVSIFVKQNFAVKEFSADDAESASEAKKYLNANDVSHGRYF
jgi:hypothetical protein